ncbi:MAG TPA: signal peptidase I [Candidatus Omnitrophica bacterium]|nr:signal peptidase I [Candidatus Omnitrophota bacterium]
MKEKSALREWIEAIVVAACLAIFLRTFFFQIYKIPTSSMVPTLMPGDKIFVLKLTYGPKIPLTNLKLPMISKLKRGDVIVFVPPHEISKPWYRRKQYVKRLIGLKGDHILIKDGNIYINGKMVVDPRIARNYYYNQGEYGIKEIVVPKDKYFFLGDNSISSFDSRFWGFVDKKDVIGKALFIWWPPKRIGMVE